MDLDRTGVCGLRRMPCHIRCPKQPRLWLVLAPLIALLAANGGGIINTVTGNPLQEPWAFAGWRAQKQPVEGIGRRHFMAAGAVTLLAASAVAAALLRRRQQAEQQTWDQRPWQAPDFGLPAVYDPVVELMKAIDWLQRMLVLPTNSRLPGAPFEFDIQRFPFTPTVLIIGNHSAGKSTFINHLLGVDAQDTGVAPTDDGFTVLERRSKMEVEDGPTLISCPDNRPFRELQRFGQTFLGHLRRKRLVLPEETQMPFDLQLVDTPGMIDLPANNRSVAKARGYHFLEVVRWMAKRADLILLFFDPDKPGTTGETLQVLTRSLTGLEHKFVIILNKVDRLDNSLDFARAYGTLGWALSKVLSQKDIPIVWTVYDSDASKSTNDGAHSLPLEAFRRKREEVILEVQRVKTRHWDNVITSFAETLRQVEMVCRVCQELRSRGWRHRIKTWAYGLPVLILPVLVATGEWWLRDLEAGYDLPEWIAPVIEGTCVGAFSAIAVFLWRRSRLWDQAQGMQLDDCFEEVHAHIFIHGGGDDERLRWCAVRPKVENLVRAVRFASALPWFSRREVARMSECLEKDLIYLRILAKAARPAEPPPIPLESPKKGKPAAQPKGQMPKPGKPPVAVQPGQRQGVAPARPEPGPEPRSEDTPHV